MAYVAGTVPEAMVWTTPDGRTINLNDHTNYFVIDRDGWGAPPYDRHEIRAAFQHGNIWLAHYAQPRQLHIGLTMLDTSYAAMVARRKTLLGLFDASDPVYTPTALGTLTFYQADGTTRAIDAIPTAGSLNFAVKTRLGVLGWNDLVVLMAPNPFWYDPAVQATTFAPTLTGLQFPFTFPITFAYAGLSQTVTLNYLGDAPAELVWWVTGPAQNPTFTNLTTNQTLSITGVLNVDDILVVDARFNFKSVTYLVQGQRKVPRGLGLDPSSGTNWLGQRSGTFWNLVPRNNLVQVQVQQPPGASTVGKVTLEYYTRYTGV